MGLLDSLTAQLQDNGSMTPAGMGLLSAGLGILANNRGLTSGLPALGMGGQQGLETYASAKQLGMQQKLQDAQLQQAQFGLKQKQFLYDLAKQYMAPTDAGTAPSSITPASGAPASGAMPPAAPGADNPLIQSHPMATWPQPSQPAPQQAPQQAGGPFGNMPGGLVAYGLMADPGKLFEVAANQYAPTDLMKTMTAMGIQRGSPQWNQALQQNVTKSNYIAPVSGRPGGYLSYPDGRQEQLPQVPEGYTAQKDEAGNWTIVPVPGGTEAMRASAAATAGGKAQFKPVQVYDPKTNQMVYTSEANVVGGGASQGPQPMLTLGMQARADYFRNIQDPQLKQSFAQAVYKSFQGMPNADQLGQQWSQIINGQQGGSGASGSAPGFASAPPLGKIADADATAKAKVAYMQDSFKNVSGFRTVGNMALEDIDNMMNLGNGKMVTTAGPLMAGAAGLFGANAAEYEKARDNLIATFSNQLGMSTDAARALVQGAIPDYGKPKEAIQAGLQTLRNQVAQRMVKATYLQQPYSSGDANAYSMAEGEFDQHITPSIAGIIVMPTGPQKAAALKAAAANPQQRASLQWALDHGVLK